MAQKKSPKSSKQALQRQPDPRAPVDSKLLLQHLTRLMKTLEQDLLGRADGSKGLTEALQARHAHDVAAERTADAYDPWRRGVVTQVAAAWVLNLVFVRVLEDRGLVDQNRIAGPGAEGSQGEFLKLAPFLTERDYLLTVFRELSHFEVTRELFDPKRNLAFRITPTADGAKALLQVFRQGSADAPSFRFGQADTRFLGDLYQDLSESVRKKFALLQTPDFIEAFILDRTLDPALETYGLDATTLIDPTCGSGHFLLGAFERLFDRHLRERPNQHPREAAQKALGAVFGTDINPYAVSIAKFRLMLAFLDKAGLTKLSGAPEVPLNVVVADSLFHQVAGEHPGQTDFGYRPGQKTRDWFDEAFALEEDEKAKAILRRGFAAVVGNPPYITVKDSVLREKYRGQYASAAGKYALSAPFAERFFQLCRPGAYTGMITANSFMKREFGKKLITDVLPRLDLQLVANTSGAYIPGHGTPTVLLFGQNRPPVSTQVRAVLAKRGEPTTPDDPALGHVWASIAAHFAEVGFENDFISVMDTERAGLAKHPWSLGGGGAIELKELIEERASRRLGDWVSSIGFMAITGEDDAFARPLSAWRRSGAELDWVFEFGVGEGIRDWGSSFDLAAFFPYRDAELKDPSHYPLAAKALWPYRRLLENRPMFGGQKYKDVGRPWFCYHQVPLERLRNHLSIAFAFVATHNHFVLDRGGKVFKQSAPIIKLPESATEDDHYALLAYLNSSTACFWMKQVYFKKYSANQKHNSDIARIKYEFAGTPMRPLPLPAGLKQNKNLISLSRSADEAAQQRAKCLSRKQLQFLQEPKRAGERIGHALEQWEHWQARGVYLQEEIDWAVYQAFELAPPQATPWLDGVVPPGGRPFEVETGHHQGFTERIGVANGVVASSATPPEWRARMKLLTGDLALIETSEFKRTWRFSEENTHPDVMKRKVIQALLWEEVLDAIEAGFGASSATSVLTQHALLTPVDVALDELRGQVFLEALSEPAGVVASKAVPYLSALRYSATGLEKHALWLKTWELQRREDEGQTVGPIAVPPEYKPEDFKHTAYWSLRGKLDVPKERFISYAGCVSDEDESPVYGWAGWNHLDRARALAALYDARKEEGWKIERLLPMLVGLLELLPWLKQYHNAPDVAVGGERPAEEFEAFIAGELRNAGKTALEAEREVLAWAQAGGAKSGSRNAAQGVATEMEGGEPESGTRSSGSPGAVDDASRVQSSKAARLRKARPRDTGTPENDTDEALESSSPSRPRAAAAGTSPHKRRPATSPASKRKKG